MRRLIVLVGVVWAVVGVVDAGDAPCGHRVLNGGGVKPRDVMKKFVELAGGADGAIVVFPTASEFEDTRDYYGTLLREEYNYASVTVAEVFTPKEGQDEAIAARVAAAGGIFFSGCDQTPIMRALRGTRVGVAVRAVFDRGAVVGGTSAGTACQSGLMITGNGDFDVTRGAVVALEPDVTQ